MIALLLYWALIRFEELPLSNWLMANLGDVKLAYENNPVVFIALFFLSHLLASTFSIPGSCTFLNTLSGAIFGFWQGVLIVYIVTIMGSCLGYWLGKKLSPDSIKKKYAAQIEKLTSTLSDKNYFFLIALRLSPLLPFGIINILLGFLGINFGLFLMTTIVGVFFDVVLLNSFGAFLAGAPKLSPEEKAQFLMVFTLLVLALYCVRILKKKWMTGPNIEES